MSGLFEYAEYISLKAINDPNEGYETITDLMHLQDQIDAFQKLIFSHFHSGTNNECKIAALVPLVTESYATDDEEALEPLRRRYDAQHRRLVQFYFESSNLRYLTSLITVPKLPQEPPNLLPADDKPGLPARPTEPFSQLTPKPLSLDSASGPEPVHDFWSDESSRQQEEFEKQQQALGRQWEEQQIAQDTARSRAQKEFEERQFEQAEQQRLRREQLVLDQLANQTRGQIAHLEQENLSARAQYDRDQLLLQQYDEQLKTLERRLAEAQLNFNLRITTKDNQISALNEQIKAWRAKYEAIAKLYAKLREEHLGLLQASKSSKIKAASAEEAIRKCEKLERDMKAKNFELANMIRERDKAFHERDRLLGARNEEAEKLQQALVVALDRAESAERQKKSELSDMCSQFEEKRASLEEELKKKSKALEDTVGCLALSDEAIRRKEAEMETYQVEMERALEESVEELEALRLSREDSDQAMDAQIDNMLSRSVLKLHEVIDSVLQSGVLRIDEALYDLDSAMQAGNQNASTHYVQSQIEKALTSLDDFAAAFRMFLVDGPDYPHAEIIRTVAVFSSAIAAVLNNTKGLIRWPFGDSNADQLVHFARLSATTCIECLRALQSFRLVNLSISEKEQVVSSNGNRVRRDLSELSGLVDALVPHDARIDGAGDLEELVDREMLSTTRAVNDAASKLATLKAKTREGCSTFELRVHDGLLDASVSITDAVAELVNCAIALQNEIVREGRGNQSRTAFYKRNNRWTEGLISAAKAVAASTNTLIEAADGVIAAKTSPEYLIVASNDVAASTAQLVAASRVKASFRSKRQDSLEKASRSVNATCKNLVKQVQSMISSNDNDGRGMPETSKLTAHEFKVREMEQQ
ncbi:sla2 Src-like adaptor 2, partial [Ascosphaera atra]